VICKMGILAVGGTGTDEISKASAIPLRVSHSAGAGADRYSESTIVFIYPEFLVHLKKALGSSESIFGMVWVPVNASQRPSSEAFEATPVFALAKMGGGSNIPCNDLLGDNGTCDIRPYIW
jgi:hypothetical protein